VKRALRVLENTALRKVIGPKGDEITRGWVKSHNDFYSSPSVIRMIKRIRITSTRLMGLMGKNITHRGSGVFLGGREVRPLLAAQYKWLENERKMNILNEYN
jgi:hypothetical protein